VGSDRVTIVTQPPRNRLKYRHSGDRNAEVGLAPGVNVQIAPRATLGLGVQLPLTRARALDYALFATIDWEL
jgi:hypothetical protein